MDSGSIRIARPMITIDSQNATNVKLDRDDGFWLERLGQGWLVKIYIVNLSQTVLLDSESDKRGYEQLFSEYATNFTLASLFGEKIERECGFLPQCNRQALEISFFVNKHLMLQDVKFEFCLARNHCALNDETVNKIFAKRQHKYYTMLLEAGKLAWLMSQKRRQYDGKVKSQNLNWIGLPSNYRIEALSDRYYGSQIVSELMILANTLATDFLRRKLGLALYRNEFINGDAGRAEYSPVSREHQTLKLPYYGQISSPLRRYPDLVNLRLLTVALRGESSPYSFEDLSRLANIINKREADLQHKSNRQPDRQINNLIKPGSIKRQSRYDYKISDDKHRTLRLKKALKNQTIDFRDLYELIFINPSNCQSEIIVYLEQWPQKMPTLLNEALQKGIISQLDFDIQETTSQCGPFYSIKASFDHQGESLSSAYYSANNKKHAKQLVCLAILTDFIKIHRLSK